MATILIVDDEPDIRELISYELKKENHRILEAGDGFEGVQMVQKNRVDCIISDISMPKMSGFEMIRKIRSLGCQAPVILITGVHDPNLQRMALQYGTVAVLNKPFEMDMLVELVQDCLQTTKITA